MKYAPREARRPERTMHHTGFCRRPLLVVARHIALAALIAIPWQVAMPAPDSPQQQVFAAERAFAQSMADRNLSAFASHVSDEAIFFNGASVLHGKKEVLATWSRFFKGKTAPFSWEPDRVEVLQSGTLALSTGLVRDPNGKIIGRFNSIWRKNAQGMWQVVFDKGSPPERADKQ